MEFPYHRLPEGYLQVGSMLEHVLQDAVVAESDPHGLLAVDIGSLRTNGVACGAQGNTAIWNCDARHRIWMGSGCSGSSLGPPHPRSGNVGNRKRGLAGGQSVW